MTKKLELPINEIIYLYSIEGYSAIDLSKQYNCSNCSIASLLKKYNIPTRGVTTPNHRNTSSHKIVLSKTQIDEIVKLYAIDHLSSVKIGEQFNISFTTIIRILKEHNIPILDSRHDKQYSKHRIRENELPSFIKGLNKITNSATTGEITCTVCHNIRRVTLSRARIKDIVASNGRCNSCVMKTHRKILDLAIVKERYNDSELATKKIANKFNVSTHTLYKFMKDNGLHIRTKGETHRLVHQTRRNEQNKGTLEKPEIGYKCRGTEIGLNDVGFYKWVECPICHKQRWQHISHARKSMVCKPCAVNPTLDNKGTIESPIIGDIQRGSEIGKRGVYYKWVICPECNNMRWESKGHARKLHLCPNCAPRIRGLKLRRENSPNWMGGLSLMDYPTDFNNYLKDIIRKRDNYTCQMCGKQQGDNVIKLAVHHIDYNKHNIEPNNLISLCPQSYGSCHIKTNHNRPHWTYYFQNLLRERGLLTEEPQTKQLVLV